jgi:hypothetical protein
MTTTCKSCAHFDDKSWRCYRYPPVVVAGVFNDERKGSDYLHISNERPDVSEDTRACGEHREVRPS